MHIKYVFNVYKYPSVAVLLPAYRPEKVKSAGDFLHTRSCCSFPCRHTCIFDIGIHL